jgi:hypothetical protein
MTRDTQGLAAMIDFAIRDALTTEEYTEMRRLNATDAYKGSDSCASHAFCDTNYYACAAFEFMHGREPDLSKSEELSLISDALDIAHRVYWAAA